ncbi:SDR family oxidoreductase [Actinomycetota bacterium]
MTTTLITGASSGLGAEMARQFAALGHDLALVARRVDRLDGLQAELLAAHPGRRVEVRALDVTDPVAVRQVVHELNAAMGGLDRVIVNAGLGKGAPIGTGGDAANRETAQTNVLGALAQCESAMEVFRQRGQGHLVVISSVSAMRGMPKAMTTYAASKAFVAHLAEGIRAEVMGEPGLAIDVTTVYPGYIRSEMNDRVVQDTPLMVSTEEGVRAIVVAVEKRAHNALVPPWPWEPIGRALKVLPLQLVRRLG